MATYKVLVKSFINNAIQEEGAIVEYDGVPGSNLELVSGSKAEKPKGKKPDSFTQPADSDLV